MRLNFEDVEGDTLSEKCLSLALMVDRYGRRAELLTELTAVRPNVDWTAFE